MLRRPPRVVYLFLILVLSLKLLQHLFGIGSVQKFNVSKLETKNLFSIVNNPLHLLNARVYPETENYELKDWHDYVFIEHELKRTGPGENGSAVFITSPEELRLSNDSFKIEGLNVVISDKISVNRSLPDVRHKS